MNRRQRRIAEGINKKGLHNPRKKALMLFMGDHNQFRFKMYTQILPNGDKVEHTVAWPKSKKRR